jgi:hypothetical protein
MHRATNECSTTDPWLLVVGYTSGFGEQAFQTEDENDLHQFVVCKSIRKYVFDLRLSRAEILSLVWTDARSTRVRHS